MITQASLLTSGALISVRFALAIILAIAAIPKLRNPDRTREMLLAFGVPNRVILISTYLLPAIELAVAIALIPSLTLKYAGMAATILFCAFSAAIGFNLALGRRPTCYCFGESLSAPIGISTLIRNAILTIAAAAIFLRPEAFADPRFLDWLGRHSLQVTFAGLVAASIVLTNFLLFQILRQQGRILLSLNGTNGVHNPGLLSSNLVPAVSVPRGLPIGSSAPSFELPTSMNDTKSLKEILDTGFPILIFFLHPGCGPCLSLTPQVAMWSHIMEGKISVVIISAGSPEENQRIFALHKLETVLLQRAREVMDQYKAPGTPSAVLVMPDGTVGSLVATGSDEIAKLVEEVTATNGLSSTNGEIRYESGFRGHTAKGDLVELSQYAGRELTLLFWNPQCGFCQDSVEDLLHWQAQCDAPLVVVSTNRDHELESRGLRAPIVMDEDRRLAAMYGAGGTPMAVRVNANGIVNSGLVAGKAAVMDLLNNAPC